MARRKNPDASGEWGIADSKNLFEKMLDKGRQKAGQHMYLTGAEAEARTVGLRLPALSLRYLFQSNVLPLSRTTVIIGKQWSCKSAFLYEIMRWHREAMGFGILLETEHKDSPELRLSLTNYDDSAVVSQPCASTDEWMQGLKFHLDNLQNMCTGTKSNPGPGRRVPVIFGVDSLTGTVSDATSDKFDKDGGSPGRRFAVEAMMIADFFRYLPPKLYDWPITLVCTNHNKPVVNAVTMRPESHTPGGAGPKFGQTYEIEMAYIKKATTAEWEGVRVSMYTSKDSLGPGRKKIEACLLWKQEYLSNGNVVQRTFWDWHSASIEMLFKRLDPKNSFAEQRQRINEIVDLHVKSGGKVWSDALGIPSDAAVSYRKAGKMLEERDDLLKPLHAALGIRERYVFRPGVDFEVQIEEARKQAVERAESNYPLLAADFDDASLDDDLVEVEEGGDD